MDILETFNPLSDRMFRILDDEGRIVPADAAPGLPPEARAAALEKMLFVRTADRMAVSYQRQGRMYTYPPNFGQEAIGVGVGLVMRDIDWLCPAYRELGAWLAKGATMKDIFLYFSGSEDGCRLEGAPNMLPFSVPISSQNLHAAGIGYALRYQGKPGVVFVFFGDGGTSEGDFHEALNFAGVWKAPVVFVCQNNQYAISCPRSKQTASKTLAIKAVAYGIAGIQVDGNDLLAVHDAALAAREHAEAGKGPVLIEALTYRRGAHTTSDDPTRYRSPEEEALWEPKDPVRRLRLHVESLGLWDAGREERVVEQFTREIDARFTEVENHPPYALEDVFRFHYAVMPDELKRQMVETRKFLNWKESRQ